MLLFFMGGIHLDPPSDNWTRTIYTNNKELNQQVQDGLKSKYCFRYKLQEEDLQILILCVGLEMVSW